MRLIINQCLPTYPLPSATIVSAATHFTPPPLLSSLSTTTPPVYHRSICCARSCKRVVYPEEHSSSCPLPWFYVHWEDGKRRCRWPYSRLNGKSIIFTVHVLFPLRSFSVTFHGRGDIHIFTIIGRLTNRLRETWEVFQGISCHCCFFIISSLPKVIVGFDHSL